MKPRLIGCFERRYDAILAEGFLFHEAQAPLARAVLEGGGKRRGRAPRRTGHNRLLRLAARKEDTLRFLHEATVPFTRANNQAERDGRMMKLRQKISGGFRSLQGAMDFALIRSFVSTAKKQGWNIIDALTRDPSDLAKSVVVEAHQAGLRDRCRHRMEAVEPAGVGNQLRSLRLEHFPDRPVRELRMAMCPGVGNAFIQQPGVQLIIVLPLLNFEWVINHNYKMLCYCV